MASKSKIKTSTSQIIDKLFEGLDARQVKVLTKRHGLDNGEEMTLAKLGKIFSVTRERIRQIESTALAQVHKKTKDGHIDELVNRAVLEIEKTGGIRKEDALLQELKTFAENNKSLPINFANQIRFLLEISGQVYYHREDEELSSHWHLSEVHQKKALDFLDSLITHLREKKHETLHKDKFKDFFQEIRQLHKLEEDVANHYLLISRRFGKNIYGDFGLMEWAEVNPRVARDWIYLILKRSGKPLHFRDIASEVRKHRTSSKKTNAQTIHNELIKDKRFILVGRGIYGLREMDKLPAGTIRDILVHILKDSGAAKPKDIITRVLEHRIFKETTILFNLQNKKYFKRLSNGAYDVTSFARGK